MNIIKQIFHISNFILIILYLSPCSLFGYFINNDCSFQPQITEDFIISSNHLFAFILISILGFFAFKDNLKKIFIYLMFISIFLELCHLVISDRTFQLEDLFGNISGILLSLLLFKTIKRWLM